MNIEELSTYLGKTNQDEKFIAYLALMGIDINSMEIEEYVQESFLEDRKNGFCLGFTDRTGFLDNYVDEIIGTSGIWYFTHLFLYAEGKDDYNEFKGVMPYGITFQNTVSEVIEKIGREPDFTNEYINRWGNLDGKKIAIDNNGKHHFCTVTIFK